MSQVKQLKDHLEAKFTNYKRHLNSLVRAVGEQGTSVRALKSKIETFESSLESLNAAHTSWVSKAEPSEEDLAAHAYSNQWLEQRWVEADQALDQANEILHALEDESKPKSLQPNQQMLIQNEKMTTLRASLELRIQQLVKETGVDSIPSSSHTIFSNMVADVKNKLNKDFRDLAKGIVESSAQTDISTVVRDFEKFCLEQENLILTIELNLAKSAPTTGASNTVSSNVTRTRSIEMEKCKVPTFDGDTIAYPEFKRSWKKVAGSQWDDDNQLEQLKFKVDPHTRRIISRCNNMTEAWKALDDEYAQEEEVVNAVNKQQKKLKLEECNTPEYIVSLRNHLPVLEAALDSVKGLEHLQTPDKVNFLVEKFDSLTQRDWEYFKSKNSGRTWDRFFSFILDRYDACRSTIARMRSQESESSSQQMSNSLNVNSTSASCVKCSKWIAQGGTYSCPACGHHASEGSSIGHCLQHCQAFVSMSANQRSDCVQKAQWCPIHLSATHSYENCSQKSDPRMVCGLNGCTKHHHRTLHESTTSFMATINSLQKCNDQQSRTSQSTPVLLSMQALPTVSGSINGFFDDGSDCSLILNSAANRLGLLGEDVQMEITTVTGVVKTESKIFSLSVVDQANQRHEIKAFGLDRLNGDIQQVNVNGVKELFSSRVQNMWDKVASRPSGEVELLIGSDYLGLHPTEIERVDNLKVYASKFAPGFVIAGKHANLKFVDTIDPMKTVSFHVSLKATKLSFKSIREYFDANDLNVEAPRRCNNCLNCNECSFQGHQMSLREQYEYEIMKKNVTYDDVDKVYRVEYPFLEDPSVLTNNFNIVSKIAMREEKKLVKEGLLNEFNAEFDKMIRHGALVELSEDCMNAWRGPVHYTSLQHVVKPESSTTPLRIVSNSSLSDRNGNSLNSIMMKGPNSLSDQRDVVSRWRTYDSAISTDLTKAYFAMKTGALEMHLRRVVWRYGQSDSEWRHFGYATVSFGDKPAGVFLDIVINDTAERFKQTDLRTAQKIKDDRYVDDVATGGSPSEVAKMAGSRSDDAENKFKTNGTLSNILSNGSLSLKAVVVSGETDEDVLKKLGNKVLGMVWNASEDLISIDMGASSTLKTMLSSEIEDMSLTMRKLLRIINKPHDILGLVSPITIQAMIAYRDLFKLDPPLSWDDELLLKEKVRWAKIFRAFHGASSVWFERAIKPKNATGDPEIVGYFDGSDDAYAAVLYLRWTLVDGTYASKLACAKAKVTPLKRISTPRAELNGAVLLSRLVLFYVRSCSKGDVLPKRVWLLGDSECTLACTEKTSGALGEYFGNRVGEIHDNQSKIQEICAVGNKGEWWHVPGPHNAADQATRTNSTAEMIDQASAWQIGPSYLKDPFEMWPVDRNFASCKEQCIPDEEILKRYRGQVNRTSSKYATDVGVHKLIDPTTTNDWDRLIRVTQLLLQPFCHKRGVIDNSAIVDSAERLWFLYAMEDTSTARDRGKLKSLFVDEKDGLIVVIGRAKTGMSKVFGKEFLPILMKTSRIAYLIMLWAHNTNHDGRDLTMSIANSKAWIVGAKSLATSICNSCPRCRLLHKLNVQQRMADLPDELQHPCPPFTNVGVDLCGPLVVKAMTNKRASMKVWPVLFVCLNTKALSMYLAPGYSTKDFFIAYNSFTSDRGHPNLVHSDRGTQLVAASKEVAEFDWNAIASESAIKGTSWKFTPAGAQWRNGAVEIFVKKFKKSFEHLYSNSRLNYAEMQCALKRIASLLNDRPLSVQKSTNQYPDKDFLVPITPNMLLTGRSGNRAPPASEIDEESDCPQNRLSHIEELELSWWTQYKVQYFASLVPTQKWIKAGRNMQVGDVVLIEYKTKASPGTYRLGRVKAVQLDSDQLVRTCDVTYSLIKPSRRNSRDVFTKSVCKQVRLPVQRLVLVVPVEEQ